MQKTLFLSSAGALAFCAFCAYADDAGQASDTVPLHIDVHPLVRPRNTLSTETGSSEFTFSETSLTQLPLGDDTSVNQVLLQAPGVAQDSYGQVHVRGDHGNLQYRINGIILPEGITGFGQALDTHFADKIDFLTGALPAQYGYRTAGVVDITTKDSIADFGGRTSITAGSNHTLEGTQELYGSKDNFNYYFTGDYLQNDRGLEPPTAANNTTHNRTTQDKQFGYLSYAPDPDHKLSFLFGNATNRFEIPSNPGQPQQFGLNGIPTYPSAALNENQYEHNTYAIGALQGAASDDLHYQFALFTRDSSVLFKPDPIGDLIYNGIAARSDRESITSGIQNDWSYDLNDTHTLRAGWSGSYEQAKSDNLSLTFPADNTGAQVSDVPFSIIDNSKKDATLFSAYLQDEWHPLPPFTVNYGLRFDTYDAYVSENQRSPRIGAIYNVTAATRLHAGYARYFTPPPTELIAPVTLTTFNNTTAQTPNDLSTSVRAERDDYFDMGIIQKAGPHLTLGVDAYYKLAHNLLDEGQFGQALIFAPFNYVKGVVKGVEFTADYKKDAYSAYANLALGSALGKGVASGQYNFGENELDYIASHYVHLDHDQLVSGSAGGSYNFRGTNFLADMLYGSGLRDGFANTGHLPFYTQVNLAAEHDFDLGSKVGPIGTRLSLINLFDRVYEIRDGSGIGVFAPQYGPRRGVFLTLSKAF